MAQGVDLRLILQWHPLVLALDGKRAHQWQHRHYPYTQTALGRVQRHYNQGFSISSRRWLFRMGIKRLFSVKCQKYVPLSYCPCDCQQLQFNDFISTLCQNQETGWCNKVPRLKWLDKSMHISLILYCGIAVHFLHIVWTQVLQFFES